VEAVALTLAAEVAVLVKLVLTEALAVVLLVQAVVAVVQE
jgi:hypothetical protein